MTLSEFQTQHGARLRAYTYNFWRHSGAPDHVLPDIRQAAWLGVAKGLLSWRPGKGRSVFHWCCLYMHREMQCELDMFRGAKHGRLGRPKPHADLVRDMETPAAPRTDSIDVQRLLSLLTEQERRLVLARACDVEGPTLAAREGVTRQRIQQIQDAAIKRMRRVAARDRPGEVLQ